MQDRQYDKNRPSYEQKDNPEKLAATDEGQREAKNSGEKPKETPTGNEQKTPNTEGTQAGMGE